MTQLPAASSRNSSDSGISSQRSSFLRKVTLGPVIDLVARRLVEQVAHAAHGADVDAERLELLAHPMDVDFDGVRADVVAEAEQMIDHLLLAHDPALPRQTHLDHRELARRQLDRLLVVKEPSSRRVEAQLAVGHAGA